LLGSTPADFIAANVIDVYALDQLSGIVSVGQSDGSNEIRVRGDQTTGATIVGTPNVTDIIDIIVFGGAVPAVASNTVQKTSLTVSATSTVTWTFPYAFNASPYVVFSPQSPSGALDKGIWISSLSNSSVSIYNDNPVTVTLNVVANRV
jgi:hypothetical protein